MLSREEERLIIAKLNDLIYKSNCQMRDVGSDFFNLHQKSIVKKHLSTSGEKWRFFGGYDEAERNIVIIGEGQRNDSTQIGAVRVTKKKGSDKLTHRDYLGSILALGIRREKIGDILVTADGADIICKHEMIQFVISNLTRIGRAEVKTEKMDLQLLEMSKSNGTQLFDTVASMRFDNVVSSMFRIGRKEAALSIERGLAFINDMGCEKVDKEIKKGDKITLRGRGKGYLEDVGGLSKKNRIKIHMTVYVK